MDLAILSQRAMEIRQRFAEMEQAKFRREWTREEVMQGFMVDVGDLMRLVMAKSGIRHVDDLERKLAHELSDCLWCVLVLSKLYDIDLAQAFTKTMDELDVWIADKMRSPGAGTAVQPTEGPRPADGGNVAVSDPTPAAKR